MKISVTERGDDLIVRMSGAIEVFHSAAFKKKICDIINLHDKNIVVDFTDIGFTDSSALSTLIACKRLAEKKELKFSLIHVPESMLTILRLAALDAYFTIYESYEDIASQPRGRVFQRNY